jgi:nitrate/nitrite transporter NarK
MASGVLSGAMQAGGVLGMLLTGALLARIGWEWLFAWYALPGLIWAVIFFRWFRDRPADHPSVNAGELELLPNNAEDHPDAPPREATPWLLLVTSPPMWCICGQQFFRAAGYIFYATWFATFLQEDRGVSIAESGVLGSLPLFAGIVGGPLGGAFADWVLVRTGSQRLAKQGVGTVSLLASAALVIVAYGVQNTTAAVLTIAVGAFCASLAGGITYSTTIDMGGRNVATVFGAMNMWGNIGAAVFPLVVPLVLAAAGGEWISVIYLFGGLYLGAALCWLCLNPHGTFAEHSLLRK